MGGIIMGALGGLGQGAQATATALNASAMQDQQLDGQKQLAQIQADLGLQKAQALEQFKSDLSDTNRENMAARIDEAKQGIISNAINQKYAQSDAAVQAANNGETDAPLTDDQKAVIAQSKALDAAKLDNPDTTVQAGVVSGDISPIDAAKLASSKDIAQLRNENFRDRTDAMIQMRQIASQAQIESANIRAAAAEERARSGGVSASMKTMLINSENANIKASTSEMNMLSRQLDTLSQKDPQRSQINDRISELRDEIKAAQANKNSYMQDLGILKPAASSGTKPAPAGTAMVANPFAPKADPLGLFKK